MDFKETANAVSTQKRVIVLGAGLAGLSAAWVLGKSGYEVIIIEHADHEGGLAITKTLDGFEYDLGPHNIHTTYGHVLAFFRRHLGSSLFEHSPKSKILKRGKVIDYPLRGIRVITSLPVWKLPPAICSFFLARLRMFLGRQGPDNSFESWITNRFGGVLYKEYFGPYAEKVWRIAPEQIDRYVAEKRVPIISLTELVRAALFNSDAGSKHPEFLDHNYYLRHGIGETVSFFKNELKGAGVRTELKAHLRRVYTQADRINSITYENMHGVTETLSTDYLLSTIPLNDLIALIDEAPANAREAGAQLDYCASVLVFLRVGRTNVLPSEMVYFSEPSVTISRVYDVGMYSRAMVPEGKTMLCLEYPCSVGDPLWNTEDAVLAQNSIEVLAANRFILANEIEGYNTERISHSYPRFRTGFLERVQCCVEFLQGFRNMVSYGRQGSFGYLNTDGVLRLGFKAASSVMITESTGHSCWEWFQAD
jgi:protoporphyrinogen oxidase